MNRTPRADIIEVIRSKYGSDPESPRFEFVQTTWRAQPYAALVEGVRRATGADITDVTDLNEDVSFVYEVRRAAERLSMQLSMVGPFAVMLRSGGERAEVVTPAGAASALERAVAQAIEAGGLELLDEETLTAPVALRLSYVEPAETKVFQALFSDLELIPWAAPTLPEAD